MSKKLKEIKMYECYVCEGNGVIHFTFTSALLNGDTRDIPKTKPCDKCGGKGVIRLTQEQVNKIENE